MPTESHGIAPALAEPDRPKEDAPAAERTEARSFNLVRHGTEPPATQQAAASPVAGACCPEAGGDPLKPWRTAQARALLAGFSAALIDTDDGRPQLVCSRWAMTRAFDDLGELLRWLARVEGSPG